MGECLLGTLGIIFKGKSLDHFVNGHLATNISCTPLGDEFCLVKMLFDNTLFHRKFCFYLKKEHFQQNRHIFLFLKQCLRACIFIV